MSLPGSYIVICEGASEANYLTLLNRLLATLPTPAGLNGRSLRFNLPTLGRGSLDHASPYAGRCVGSGRFSHLEGALRKVTKENKGVEIVVWADWDLYVRNDHDCLDNYLYKKPGIPDFCFSFQNFEDFWAMHLEDELFHEWLRTMTAKNHWTVPLHSDDYLPLIQGLVFGYEKGKLQDGDLTVERINNMRNHIFEITNLLHRPMPATFHLFADFLSSTLNQFYPTVFSSNS